MFWWMIILTVWMVLVTGVLIGQMLSIKDLQTAFSRLFSEVLDRKHPNNDP